MDINDGKQSVYCFSCRGHENISAKHLTTIEVTKDSSVSLRGDCIVGVSADFDAKDLQVFLDGATLLAFSFSCKSITEHLTATFNHLFRADREIVIRRGPFPSERTIATHADKACVDLSKDFVEMIKNPKAAITVEIRRLSK